MSQDQSVLQELAAFQYLLVLVLENVGGQVAISKEKFESIDSARMIKVSEEGDRYLIEIEENDNA